MMSSISRRAIAMASSNAGLKSSVLICEKGAVSCGVLNFCVSIIAVYCYEALAPMVAESPAKPAGIAFTRRQSDQRELLRARLKRHGGEPACSGQREKAPEVNLFSAYPRLRGLLFRVVFCTPRFW